MSQLFHNYYCKFILFFSFNLKMYHYLGSIIMNIIHCCLICFNLCIEDYFIVILKFKTE